MSNFNFEYGPKWIEENGSYTFVVNNTEKSPVIEVKSDFSFLPDSAYNPSFKTIKFTITNDDNGTTLNQFTISGKNKIQFNLDESNVGVTLDSAAPPAEYADPDVFDISFVVE